MLTLQSTPSLLNKLAGLANPQRVNPQASAPLPRFQGAYDTVEIKFGKVDYVAAIKNDRYGFVPQSLQRTLQQLRKTDSAFDISILHEEDAQGQMQERVVITPVGGNPQVVDPHDYGATYHRRYTGADHRPITLNAYNNIYPANGYMLTPQKVLELTARVTHHEVNEPEGLVADRKTLPFPWEENGGQLIGLGIGTGSGVETDLLHNAITNDGVKYLELTNPEDITQIKETSIEFPPNSIQSIKYIGTDVVPEAADSANEIYGVFNRGIENPHKEKPYFEDYLIGAMHESTLREEIKKTLGADKRPNLFLAPGVLVVEDHAPFKDFLAAFNMVAKGGLLAFNLQDRPMKEARNKAGFTNLLEAMRTDFDNGGNNKYFRVLAFQEGKFYRLGLDDLVRNDKASNKSEEGIDLEETKAAMEKDNKDVMTSGFFVIQKLDDVTTPNALKEAFDNLKPNEIGLEPSSLAALTY